MDDLKEKATCFQCQQPYSECSKILPGCLHTFCLPCLSKLPVTTVPTTSQSRASSNSPDRDQNHSQQVASKHTSQNGASKTSETSDQPVTKVEKVRKSSSTSAASTYLRPRALSDDKSQGIYCPKCGCLSVLPKKGVSDFQMSLVAQESIAAYKHLENYNKDSPVCEQCMGSPPARGFCYTCYSFICKECLSLHERWAEYESHEFDDLDVFQQKRSDPSITSEAVLQQSLESCVNMCPKHSDEKLKFFCTSCEELLCHDCTVVAHRTHTTVSVTAEVVEEHRKKIIDALKELDGDRQSLDECSGTVLTRSEKLSSMKSNLKTEISTKFTQLEESLKSRKGELLSKVDEFTQPPLKALEEFRERLETLQTQVHESYTVIDSNLKHKGPTGILSIEHIILRHMDHLKSQCQSIGAVQEVPTIAFQNPEGLNDTIQSCGDVVTLDPNSSIRSSSPRPTYSSTPVRYSSSSPYSSNLLLETLSSQLLESLNFSALSLGRSFINQSDDIPSNEPQRSRDIDNLISGVPVRTIDDFNRPSGITVANNIIVCELGVHQVVVLDYLGRKMLTIGTQGEEDGHFLYPQKAVFTHDSEIIITDGNCRFQIFSPAGKWLKTVETDFNPASIAIGLNQRMYVCNKVNHEIRIFNSDFTLHKRLGRRGCNNGEFNNPSGIVADLNGHLYIADTWNHRIQVLNEDGTFVRKFGTKGSNPGQLNSPSNLCLDPEGRFLFVSESRNHRVSVFKTENGQFVKCFGRHGKGLGELNRPRGITMDFNRLLYVCDYANNRIQIFK